MNRSYAGLPRNYRDFAFLIAWMFLILVDNNYVNTLVTAKMEVMVGVFVFCFSKTSECCRSEGIVGVSLWRE